VDPQFAIDLKFLGLFSKFYMPLMHGWWWGLLAKLEALEGAVA
jgi:hypothetical protein